MKRTISEYKKDISLPDFLECFGFEESKSRSSSDWRKLTNGYQLFLIGKNENDEFFFYDTQSSERKRRDIFNFIDKYSEVNLNLDPSLNGKDKHKKICTVLDKYLSNKEVYIDPKLSSYSVSYKRKISDEDFVKELLTELEPLKHKKFFYGRSIEDKIINHPFFKNKIFNQRFNDKTTGKTHINTAFIFSGENDETTGFSLRNLKTNDKEKSFAGFRGTRASSVFMSNNDNQQIDKFYVAESVLNCMTYFQENFEELENKNIKFISSEGSLEYMQIKNILEEAEKKGVKEIISIRDNDPAGIRFDLAFINKAKPEKIVNKLWRNIDISFHTVKKQAYLSFEIDKNSKNPKLYKDIHEFKEKIGSDLKLVLNKESENPLKHELKYQFTNTKENWLSIYEFVHADKFNSSEYFGRVYSNLSDFNDDLMFSKGIHPEYHPEEYKKHLAQLGKEPQIKPTPESILKKKLDEIINKSSDFPDFIAKTKATNITIVVDANYNINYKQNDISKLWFNSDKMGKEYGYQGVQSRFNHKQNNNLQYKQNVKKL